MFQKSSSPMILVLLAVLLALNCPKYADAKVLRGASREIQANATRHVCPMPAQIGEICKSSKAQFDPVTCTASASGGSCFYHHMCDALTAGFAAEECVPTMTGRQLASAKALQKKVDKANAILLSLDLKDKQQVQKVLRKFNVTEDDAPYVLQQAQALQDEQNAEVTTMAVDSDSVFVNQELIIFPLPTPAMGGAWRVGDIVVGVGGGLGIEVGVRYGRLKVRADYYRTKEICQYEMNSFSFIVGYTNINLFSDGTWVGTFQSAGVGIGSYIATGAAFFCEEEGQDPLDCMVNV